MHKLTSSSRTTTLSVYVPSLNAKIGSPLIYTSQDSGNLNYASANNAYVLATIFSLAHPYGTPTVLSSYSFSDTNAGAPNNGYGTCSGTGGSNGWLCQHRWIAFAGMTGFHNTVGTGSLNNWIAPSSQRIAFGRGASPFSSSPVQGGSAQPPER